MVWSLLAVGCAGSDGTPFPPIQDGVIDVSEWDFEANGPIRLDGNWLFAWETFLASGENWADVQSYFTDTMKVPGGWRHQRDARTGDFFSTTGYGTYALRIEGLDGRKLGLALPDALSAICVYTSETSLDDRHRHCRGQPATNPADEVPYYHSYEMVELSAQRSSQQELGSVVLYLEMSNFVHARGGINRTIQLYEVGELRAATTTERERKTFALGILLCFSIYHLLIFGYRRDDQVTLMFGVFVLAIVMRSLSSGAIRLVYTEPSAIAFEILIRMEYISISMCVICGLAFIESILPSSGFKRLNRWFIGVGFLLTLVPLVTPVRLFSQLAFVFQGYAALTGVIAVSYLVIQASRGRWMATYMLAAFSFLLAATVNDILYSRDIIQTGLFVTEALVLVVAAQGVLLAGRNGALHKRLVRLTENLQEEVDAQTIELNQKRIAAEAAQAEIQKLNDYITESVLKRYLPPALIGDILTGKLSMDRPAELRDITVLFSDLQGFTATSEALGPEAISAFLNEYLTKMNEIIFEHGGTIDKFIGDAIMVLFGAPQDMSPAEQVRRATDCAKAMQVAMGELTRGWREDGAGHLEMRIGVHHGSAVVGNFGSDQRSDYTAIGPSVNLAARIESASLPGAVFVSDAVAQLLPEAAAEEVGVFELKGIDEKTTLYRVV